MWFGESNDESMLSPEWRRFVNRQQRSNDPDVRDSFFWGCEATSGLPFYLPTWMLERGHVHIRGMTGSGKTSAALMPLVLQQLPVDNGSTPITRKRCPVVVIDLKGDSALFHATWRAAIRAGRRFRYLSVQKGHDYHFFDPLQIFALGNLEPVQLATTFVRAFSLDYGLIYGGLYFTHQNLVVLLDALEDLLRQPRRELTISQISRAVTRAGRGGRVSDAQHIDSCLRLLAAYPQVNRSADVPLPEERIDMARVLEDCEVVYFYLKLQDQAPSLRQIAAFAMYTLAQAVEARHAARLPERTTYLVIDEFFHIAGKTFGDFLSTVRDYNLRLVLANQTPKQLEHHDPALPDVVRGNCSVEQAFTLTPEDERYFREASGETYRYQQSVSYSEFSGLGFSIRPELEPRLSDLDAKRASDMPLSSLVFCKHNLPGYGDQRIYTVRAVHPLRKEHYEELRAMPFPLRVEFPPVARDPSPPVPPSSASSAVPPTETPVATETAASMALEQAMRRKWKQLEALEAGQQ